MKLVDSPESQLRVAGIVNDSITDGPGIRLALFVQGCPHRCAECHNPQTHDFAAGTVMEITEIAEKIRQNPMLTGVTYSGGEPFCQAQALANLSDLIAPLKLDLAAYSGYTFEELLELSRKDEGIAALLRRIRTLVDGPYVRELRDYRQKFKGSSNQRVIDVQKSLGCGSVVLDDSERWN